MAKPKKARSAKQKANDKKLGAMAKKRAKETVKVLKVRAAKKSAKAVTGGKKRSAKQLANDKKLGAMAKKRAAGGGKAAKVTGKGKDGKSAKVTGGKKAPRTPAQTKAWKEKIKAMKKVIAEYG